MEFIPVIAEQGFGYLLFAGALLIIFFLYKETRDVNNKRIADFQQLTASFVATTKDLLNGNSNLQRSVDKITEILENMRRN